MTLIKAVVEYEILIVGTGAQGLLKVPPDTAAHFESSGIILIAEKTDEACRTYNELKNTSKVIAALHLTC